MDIKKEAEPHWTNGTTSFFLSVWKIQTKFTTNTIIS